MREYDFNFDKETLEIFPSEIYSEPSIVFHGTINLYSREIEDSGFDCNSSPFDLDVGKELIEILEHPKIAPFQKIHPFLKWRTSQFIQSYIQSRVNNEGRLSFSPFSFSCVPFTLGAAKGGQTLNNIRESELVVKTAIANHSSLQKLISQPIRDLFKQCHTSSNSRGVIYAVNLTNYKEAISLENKVVHCNKSISAENIIGKVLVPNEFVNDIPKDTVTNKLTDKLNKNAFLK